MLNSFLKYVQINGGRSIKMYRVVSKELAVAAVAILSILLVGGRGRTGAPLRAAVFIFSLLQLRGWVAR